VISDRWQLRELLDEQRGLRIVPTRTLDVSLAGIFSFRAEGPESITIEASYEIAVTIPHDFPKRVPNVSETAGRIPRSFHRNPDKTLCLGSPLEIALRVRARQTLPEFFREVLTPYLYSHAFFERFRSLPFGELQHGIAGFSHDVRRILHLGFAADSPRLLELASMRRRVANKHECPCRSRRRLGRCHNEAVNQLREALGRAWFSEQARLLRQQS
jgi:hypothetical protein